MRGEWLAPVLDLAEGGGEYAAADYGAGEGKDGGDAEMGVDGWQDLDEYQREQSVEVGETVVPAVAGELPVPAEVQVKASEPQDKEARKREKKEKEKALKREKAEKARKGASA